jgi:quercetin dioxygenase-like cupin family protein
VLFDGPIGAADGSQTGVTVVWRTDAVPASNAGGADMADRAFDTRLLNDDGSKFVLVELKPGADPLMHATNSIDYLVVLRGQVLLKLEAQEVVLQPGDLIVDRGVLHGWSALGDEPALMAAVMVPAEPLGAGARMAS